MNIKLIARVPKLSLPDCMTRIFEEAERIHQPQEGQPVNRHVSISSNPMLLLLNIMNTTCNMKERLPIRRPVVVKEMLLTFMVNRM